jgi:EAL domain-containing protein (putative c-di-GMP-specific phosphodiesterase class I)
MGIATGIPMTPIHVETPADAQCHIRIRQAILAAEQQLCQVALLMIAFEGDHATPEATEESIAQVGAILRESDVLWRGRAGEITVLLTSLRTSRDAVNVAEKILGKLNPVVHPNSGASLCRPKLGIALFPEHGVTPAALLHCAAMALKTANPENHRCVLYGQDSKSAIRSPLGLTVLSQAIARDQLYLNYQPKIDLQHNRITGLEVVTRWRHPERGLVMPTEFIPLAERTGLIVPLTLWVLNGALTQSRSWREAGFDVNIAVNVSMWNLHDPELPDQIAALLGATGVSPCRLEMEITESAIMDDPPRVMRTVKAIQDLGVRLTIDDFGIGYSSLAYLKKLPISAIKIDKSFTANMERDNNNAVIVRAIIDLGHNLGLKVIAEGVETLAVKEMLAAFGCDEAQGYYFSRPLSAPQIAESMRRNPSWLLHGYQPRKEWTASLT